MAYYDSFSMLLGIGITFLVLLSPLVAQTDVSHTCDSDEDCQNRLSQHWPYYTFQCCTTILCNEEYGYYFVHSGCTAERDCQPENQVRVGNRLAARIPISLWKGREQRLLENCPDTRQDFASLQNVESNPGLSLVNVPPPQAASSFARRNPPLSAPRPAPVPMRHSFQTPNGINPLMLNPATPPAFVPPRGFGAPSQQKPASALPTRSQPKISQRAPALPRPTSRPWWQKATTQAPVTPSAITVDAMSSKKPSFPRNHKGQCPAIQTRQCTAAGQTQECCVIVKCKPRTLKELDSNIPARYSFEERCTLKCELQVQRYGNSYTFTFPYELWWGNRDKYWNYALEPPENSCSETRYFFNFIKEGGLRRHL